MSDDFVIDVSTELGLETSVTQAICKIVGSPRALTVDALIRNKQWEDLARLSIDPKDYNDYRQFSDDYLVTELLRKSDYLPVDTDAEQAARDSFWKAEEICASTNQKIYNLTEQIPDEVRVASRWIRRVLGSLDKRVLEVIHQSCRFGPGASAFKRATGATRSDKYDYVPSLTSSLIHLYKPLLKGASEQWYDATNAPEVVLGNQFTTVPKKSTTRRGICKEPDVNCFLQLGIGSYLKTRLAGFGVDLTDQSRNQRGAQRAYAEGLATIDLSMASDTLAYSVVQLMLPSDWFELFDVCRSPLTFFKDGAKAEGRWVPLEKFSSMGNGYTFELESLIFAGVCHACVPKSKRHEICVYGDDIIVPSECADRVIEVLNYLGFKTNSEKSFLAGNFFESCGSDWFKGQPVRPFYLNREKPSEFQEDNADLLSPPGIPYTVQIANALRLYSNRINHGESCDDRFRALWVALLQASPKVWRKCRVPPSFGDTGIIVSQRESNASPLENGHEGVAVRSMQTKTRGVVKRSLGRLLQGLSLAGTEDNTMTRGFEPRRGLFGRPKTKVVPVSYWDDGFEWGQRL